MESLLNQQTIFTLHANFHYLQYRPISLSGYIRNPISEGPLTKMLNERKKRIKIVALHLRSAKIPRYRQNTTNGARRKWFLDFLPLFGITYIHYSRINGGASILLSARACVIIIAPKSSKDKVSPRAVTAVYCSYSSLLCYFLPLNLPRDQNHFLASFFLP